MQFQTGQQLMLTDAKRHNLGQITLERRENDLLVGRFAPGPDFAEVEELFRAFEDAVESQALHALDKIEAMIAGVTPGFEIQEPDGANSVVVRDVQIWRDGGVTCRIAALASMSKNGSRTGSTAQPVHE
jgi:hypothetical protein